MSPESKRRIFELGVFLVPVILVKSVIPIFGGGGADLANAASGKSRKDPQGTLLIHEDEWSDEQLLAAEYLRSLTETPETSPFDHGEALQTDSGDPVEVEPVEEPGELDATVTMIMNTAGGGVALIDGRACRVGDMVSEGHWRITAINAAERTVEFENIESGETEVRTLDR